MFSCLLQKLDKSKGRVYDHFLKYIFLSVVKVERTKQFYRKHHVDKNSMDISPCLLLCFTVPDINIPLVSVEVAQALSVEV